MYVIFYQSHPLNTMYTIRSPFFLLTSWFTLFFLSQLTCLLLLLLMILSTIGFSGVQGSHGPPLFKKNENFLTAKFSNMLLLKHSSFDEYALIKQSFNFLEFKKPLVPSLTPSYTYAPNIDTSILNFSKTTHLQNIISCIFLLKIHGYTD